MVGVWARSAGSCDGVQDRLARVGIGVAGVGEAVEGLGQLPRVVEDDGKGEGVEDRVVCGRVAGPEPGVVFAEGGVADGVRAFDPQGPRFRASSGCGEARSAATEVLPEACSVVGVPDFVHSTRRGTRKIGWT